MIGPVCLTSREKFKVGKQSVRMCIKWVGGRGDWEGLGTLVCVANLNLPDYSARGVFQPHSAGVDTEAW